MGIGEEVEEIEGSQTPAGCDQPVRIPRKGYRIAGEITNDLSCARGHGLDDETPRAGARRIEEDEVGFGRLESLDSSVKHLHIHRRVEAGVRSEERRVGKEWRCRWGGG